MKLSKKSNVIFIFILYNVSFSFRISEIIKDF